MEYWVCSIGFARVAVRKPLTTPLPPSAAAAQAKWDARYTYIYSYIFRYFPDQCIQHPLLFSRHTNNNTVKDPRTPYIWFSKAIYDHNV